jgi:hypothetical protein
MRNSVFCMTIFTQLLGLVKNIIVAKYLSTQYGVLCGTPAA